MSTQAEYSGNKRPDRTDGFLAGHYPNRIDIDFEKFVGFIEERNLSQIKEAVNRNLSYFRAANSRLYNRSIDYYNQYRLLGTYYPEKDDYTLADNRAVALTEHLEDFRWLYNILKDRRSKRILVNILYYWLMSDPQKIEQIHDQTFNQYFDLDLVECSEAEIFVDIGGYIGATLIGYARTFGAKCYQRMYCYEIVPANIENIEKNIKTYHLDNVIIRKKGAGSRNGTMYLSSNVLSSVSQLTESGAVTVPIVKIDDDIEEDVTFIKMDIEGGEEEALSGCLDKIRKNHPKLALSVHHNYKDIWKLPRMICAADPSYRFYLRYYGLRILPTEYTLYAV